MKKILCITLLASSPVTILQSANTQEKIQLPKQILSAQNNENMPAYLTTRIEWRSFPKPVYQNDDLQGQDRAAVVRVVADTTGQVKQASIQDSTGLKSLDQILLQAVKTAEVKAHVEEGNPVPTIGYQVFELKLKHTQQPDCQYAFNSKNWLAQQQGVKTRFRYSQQPQLILNNSALQDHDRQIQFHLKTNSQGQVKQVKITRGSGVYVLDQQLIHALQGVQIESKRRASSLWLYKPSSFKDEIQFKRAECY